MLRISRTLVINGGLALIVPLVLWSLYPSMTRMDLFFNFVASFVFSNCIGLLFGFFMPKLWEMPGTWPKPLIWLLRFLMFVAFATLGTLVGSFILWKLDFGPDYWRLFWRGYRFALAITIGVGGVIAMYESMKYRLEATRLQLKQRELERERALKLAADARLSSLESRIHPHFLFNTINSVAALIPEDPKRAEKMLGQMADLLRFSLDAPQLGLVPVDRELRIVEQYLEIEKARFGDRLRYRIDRQPTDLQVPPLSIQTLVENSVKYAVSPRREGAEIVVRVERGRVSVTDDGPGFNLSAIQAGHGLENLEARLKAIFPGHSGLAVRSDSRGCQVAFEAGA